VDWPDQDAVKVQKEVIVKFVLLSLVVIGYCFEAIAQGEIFFVNFRSDRVIDAPVFDTDCQTRLEGDAYFAQAYLSLTGDNLQPIGPVTSFRTGAAAGYIQGVGFVVPGVVNRKVYAQLRAWEAAAGQTYEAAVAAGGKYGFSNIVLVDTPVGPAPPATPVGLQSFCLIQGIHLRIESIQIINSSVVFDIITSVPGRKTVVQVSSNLQEWTSISTVVPGAASFRFVDPSPLNRTQRFYRLLIQPE
jgi:hypothetical protein